MATIKVSGSTLVVDDGNGTNTDITIGEVRGINFDGGSATEIDTTNFASTVKEFRPGLQDSGSATVDVNFDPDDSGQDELDAIRLAQETREFKLTFPEGTDKVLTFTAYVNSFGVDAPVDGIAQGSVSLRLTSNLVKSTS
jgi:hypothetical protein